jgi:hypothetical protein
MLVFGRAQKKPPAPWSVNVAAAYSPATNTWRRLAPPPGDPGNYEGRYSAVWTGKEMLVWGPLTRLAFNPATNHWRQLPINAGVPAGIVVWTGREMIGWGGGCCGDASAEGAAFNPATNTRRKLPRSPLAPAQRPIGTWTGRELIILVSGIDPDGKPYPASLARAAAYNPTTNRWRRIAPLPAPRAGATVVWDGHELLVVGPYRASFAYNPATNRWRRLAPMSSGRQRAAAVWTGKRLLIWGGTTTSSESPQSPPRGLAYKPTTNRWSTLPAAPLLWSVILVTGLLMLIGLMRAGSIVFWKTAPSAAPPAPFGATALVPPVALVACGIALAAFAEPVKQYADAAARQLGDRARYATAVLGDPQPATTRPFPAGARPSGGKP